MNEAPNEAPNTQKKAPNTQNDKLRNVIVVIDFMRNMVNMDIVKSLLCVWQ